MAEYQQIFGALPVNSYSGGEMFWGTAPDPKRAPELAGLWETIVANPEDTAPRLIYTDRLEEAAADLQLDHLYALADFIRVTIKARAARSDGLASEDWKEFRRLKDDANALFLRTEYNRHDHPIRVVHEGMPRFRAMAGGVGQWLRDGLPAGISCAAGEFYSMIRGGFFRRFPITYVRISDSDRRPRPIYFPPSARDNEDGTAVLQQDGRSGFLWIPSYASEVYSDFQRPAVLPLEIFRKTLQWPRRDQIKGVVYRPNHRADREVVNNGRGGFDLNMTGDINGGQVCYPSIEIAMEALGWAAAAVARERSELGEPDGAEYWDYHNLIGQLDPGVRPGDYDDPKSLVIIDDPGPTRARTLDVIRWELVQEREAEREGSYVGRGRRPRQTPPVIRGTGGSVSFGAE